MAKSRSVMMYVAVVPPPPLVGKTYGHESETNLPLSKPVRVPCPSLNPMTEAARFMGKPVERSPGGS